MSMLIIKTEYGTFGNYKDVLCYMKEERLKDIRIESMQYVFQDIPFSKGTLTIDEIKEMVK